MALAHDDRDLPPIPPELAMPEGEEPIPRQDLDHLVAWAEEQAQAQGDSWVTPWIASAVQADPQVENLANLPETVRRFRIEDDGAAEWAMRHVVEVDTEVGQLEAQRDEWMDRIGHWFRQRAGGLLARRAFFEGHLEDYLRRRRETSRGKVKTVKLPSGEVWSRGGTTPTVSVDDEPAVVAWAKENLEPEQLEKVVKTRETVLVSELRKVTQVVELITHAVVELECGDPATVDFGPDGVQEGDGELWRATMACTQCGLADAKITEVLERRTRHVIMDDAGRTVEGMKVTMPTTNYGVRPDA